MEGAKQAGAETEIIDITKLRINFCKGCINCYKRGKCAQNDDFSNVFDKLVNADGIIFSSPNYIDNVTGQFKVLLDRMANAIHEQLFDGKYGFSIVTAGGGGDDLVLAYMNNFITKTGGTAIGEVSALASQGPAGMEAAAKKANLLGNELVRAIREKKLYPEQEAAHKSFRERFSYTLKANKDNWAHNYEHWIQKGWIKG
ncbi:MAG: flavodoxin family protein, partial [Caulobacteraceae bacterium]